MYMHITAWMYVYMCLMAQCICISLRTLFSVKEVICSLPLTLFLLLRQLQGRQIHTHTDTQSQCTRHLLTRMKAYMCRHTVGNVYCVTLHM